MSRAFRSISSIAIVATGLASPTADAQTIMDRLASDPLFQRCVEWMLSGKRGAFIQEVCLLDYGIPPPSILICARKTEAAFDSPAEREGCAILFEEQAKKARATYARALPSSQ
jgi:hypothetical protein